MGKSTTNFLLVKVGKREYIEKMFNDGELYLNTTDYFRTNNDPYIGDCFEGADSVENGQVVKYRDELEYEKIYCMWNINSTLPLNNEYIHTIQHKNKEIVLDLRKFQKIHSDDSLMIIIYNVKEFNRRFEIACKKEKLNFIDRKIVSYYDEKSKKRQQKITPFMKRLRYKNQQEIRYLIKQSDDKPLTITIGNLSDIALLVNSFECKIICGGTWENN